MKIIIGIILYFLFWGICYLATGTDQKNIKGFRSYPNEVQKRVYEDSILGSLAPKKRSVPITFFSNILMFTVIFTIIGIVGKEAFQLSDFQSTCIYFLILGEGLNLFDLVIIDLIWWRNSNRIRFSCVPEKEAYQNPKKHIDSFLRGIPMFAIVAVVVAWIVNM